MTRVVDRNTARRDARKQPMVKKVCANPKCKNPVNKWPMCFRGDRACSVNCEKAVAANG